MKIPMPNLDGWKVGEEVSCYDHCHNLLFGTISSFTDTRAVCLRVNESGRMLIAGPFPLENLRSPDHRAGCILAD